MTSYILVEQPGQSINKQTQNVEKETVTKHATFPSFSTDTVEEKASLIVKGVPDKVNRTFLNGKDTPITEFQFKVTDVYKSNEDSTAKYIKVLQDGRLEDSYYNHPLMEIGNEYILFLDEPIEDTYIMVGGPSGKFEYDESARSFTSVTQNNLITEVLEVLISDN
ncbi:hypothetical protein PUW24_00325 (plasmid) [Paenibacillus urinalis]|uniref:DUF4367 domain-containing protein n=1 Tax=Paenibacillus urinalis TaxID=521520 RepID=A0AAX3N679_9BACL|nr:MULTISPECIES: hypothetical protein [Paenibacillus]WDH85338.1 hypothetical protein PUW23_26245 [Paenibacillus urinalis]WDH95222.1 hypothetical protein PUW24_00325 [Paenibacillus urinalis]WDI05301.1 hypothetical protein PUW25_27160 [Paenibacillus urinalis]